jgi:4-amino-4-deoxy-L-arabinose transferase-like glycosyltransferase
VETISPASPSTSARKLAARIGWTLLILATLYVCYFSHLGALGFVGPDEPRYAWIARDMMETGDWVTPRLYGKPWFEKPPLYYWGAAVSFKLFGVSEAAARLPSAVSALLATLAIAWLALRLYGAETARWLLVLLPTTVGMIGFSHAAATDMPFSAMLTLAMVAAAVILGLIPTPGIDSRTRNKASDASSSVISFISPTSFASFLFGFFLGLAVLAKGPAAIILCGGAVFFCALFTKRWRHAFRLIHLTPIAAFCLTALPWYILCARRNPEFLRVFIIEHNFKRYVTPEFQHVQPFWYFGAIILLAVLPWTAVFLWSLILGLRRLRSGKLGPPIVFLLSWSAFCIAFFTISKSKLPGYILPAVPPIGLILARACTFLGPVKRWSFALSCLASGALFAGIFVALSRNADRILSSLVAFAPLFGLVLLLLTVANLFLGLLFLFRHRSAALAASVLPFFAGFPIFDILSPHTPLSIVSPAYIAYQIHAQQIPPPSLRVTRLNPSTLYGLNFYLRTDLQKWDRDSSREVYVLADGELPCSRMPQDMNCSDLWGWIEKNDKFELLHLTPNH